MLLSFGVINVKKESLLICSAGCYFGLGEGVVLMQEMLWLL